VRELTFAKRLYETRSVRSVRAGRCKLFPLGSEADPLSRLEERREEPLPPWSLEDAVERSRHPPPYSLHPATYSLHPRSVSDLLSRLSSRREAPLPPWSLEAPPRSRERERLSLSPRPLAPVDFLL
jgi:hypothetical protein